MIPTDSKTLVLITGAFVSNTIWNRWAEYFTNIGYKVYVPYWPHKDAPAEVLKKKHPDPELAQLRLSQLVNYFEEYINELPQKPYLIGDGLGGAVVQLLAQQQLAIGSIVISSWPPHGMLPLKKCSLLLFTKILLNLNYSATYYMSLKTWTSLSNDQDYTAMQKVFYNSNIVPESRKLIKDMILGEKIQYNKPHSPILFIANEDPIVSYKTQYRNYAKYTDKNSQRKFSSFYFSSLIIDWENQLNDEVLSYIHLWIQSNNINN